MDKDPYRSLANIYDRFVEPFNNGVRSLVFRMFPPKKALRILEVGCGTGTNLRFYEQAGCNIFGIDLSPAMLMKARQKLDHKTHLQVADASQMPFTDGTFDIVMAMLTLHEMPYEIRPPVMREMVRVVKQGGQIILVDYHPGPILFPQGWLYKLIILFFEIAAGRRHFKNYKNFLKTKSLASLLKDKNLSIQKERIIGAGNLIILAVKK